MVLRAAKDILIKADLKIDDFVKPLREMRTKWAQFSSQIPHTKALVSALGRTMKAAFTGAGKLISGTWNLLKRLTQGFRDATRQSKLFNGSQAQGQSDIAKNTKSVLAGLTGVGALAGLWFIAAKGMRAALREMNSSTDAQIKLNQVLKATGFAAGMNSNDLMESAQAMRRATRLSTSEVQDAQGVMLTFTKIGKENFDTAMGSAADMSAMFGQSMQQSVIQLGTALNDPIAGVGRLMRIGVSFSEEQRKSIKLFMDQNDVMSAQKVILDELGHEFGGVAEALADTFFGRWTQLINAIAELAGSMGQIIEKSPAFKKVLEDIRDRVNDLATINWYRVSLEWRINFLKAWKSLLNTAFKFMPSLSSGFNSVVGNMTAAWQTALAFIGGAWTGISEFFTKDENSMEKIFEDMFTRLPDIITDGFFDITGVLIKEIVDLGVKVRDEWNKSMTGDERHVLDPITAVVKGGQNLWETIRGPKFSEMAKSGAIGQMKDLKNPLGLLIGMFRGDMHRRFGPKENKPGDRMRNLGQVLQEGILRGTDVDAFGELADSLAFGGITQDHVNFERFLRAKDTTLGSSGLLTKAVTESEVHGSNLLADTFKIMEGATITAKEYDDMWQVWQKIKDTLPEDEKKWGQNIMQGIEAGILQDAVDKGHVTPGQVAQAQWELGARGFLGQEDMDFSGQKDRPNMLLGLLNSINTKFGEFKALLEGEDFAGGALVDLEKEMEELNLLMDEDMKKLKEELELNNSALTANTTWLQKNTESLMSWGQSIGGGLAAADLAGGGSVRDIVTGGIQKHVTDFMTQGLVDRNFGGGGFLGAILPGIGGGLIGGLVGKLFSKKPKASKETYSSKGCELGRYDSTTAEGIKQESSIPNDNKWWQYRNVKNIQ
jgi:hypothetical protein